MKNDFEKFFNFLYQENDEKAMKRLEKKIEKQLKSFEKLK